MSPASGDSQAYTKNGRSKEHVSIQLMSPASGDLDAMSDASCQKMVSIQLMSPASGDSQQS